MVLGNINIHAQNPDFLFMVEYAIKAPSGHNTNRGFSGSTKIASKYILILTGRCLLLILITENCLSAWDALWKTFV